MTSDRSGYELPLLELFTTLQQKGLSLGISEYQLLLIALRKGFGMADKDALARLCKLLWIKTSDEADLFDYHFEQVFLPLIEDEQLSLPDQPEIDPSQILSGSESQPISDEAISDTQTPIADTEAPKLERMMNDEVQVVKAILPTTRTDHWLQTDEYLPITRQQMKHYWRYLRYPLREGPLAEMDISSTVETIGRQGLFVAPVLQPQEVNRAELLLLIDQGGSMVPFHPLSYRLAATALRSEIHKIRVYYFHNYPSRHLYCDSSYQDARSIRHILGGLQYNKTRVFIFSDAGAARGAFNSERALMTKQFLDHLKQHIRYIAWLNPMPRSRWKGTTAEQIRELIPMFDLSRQGLENIMNVLCGRRASHLLRGK